MSYQSKEHKNKPLINKEYKIFLNKKEFGTSKLDKGDASMGTVFLKNWF